MNWIPEKEAAEIVNRKPKTLRALVKSGKWNIDYTAPNNRKYQYSEKSLEKFLLENSSAKQ